MVRTAIQVLCLVGASSDLDLIVPTVQAAGPQLVGQPLAGPSFVALFPKLTWTIDSNRQVNGRLQDVPITRD